MSNTFKVHAVVTREYNLEIKAANAEQAQEAAVNQIGEELGIITSEWTIDCTVSALTEKRAAEKAHQQTNP